MDGEVAQKNLERNEAWIDQQAMANTVLEQFLA
jgi:hypothetical protein